MSRKRNSTPGSSASSDLTGTGSSGRSRTRKPKAGYSGKSDVPFEAAVPLESIAATADKGAAESVIAPESTRPRSQNRPSSASAPSAGAAILAAASAPASRTVETTISEEERIALLAYSFWEARGRQGGCPEDDWFRAEREIRSPKQPASAPND